MAPAISSLSRRCLARRIVDIPSTRTPFVTLCAARFSCRLERFSFGRSDDGSEDDAQTKTALTLGNQSTRFGSLLISALCLMPSASMIQPQPSDYLREPLPG